MRPDPAPDPLLPRIAVVLGRRVEAPDVVTLDIAASGPVRPGQFAMLTAFGVGEAAISMSGDPADGIRHCHTIHAVGPVSAALTRLVPGARLGIRGPYGRPWPVGDAQGGDLLVVASGLGLAPLRPAVLAALAQRRRFGRIVVLYGARTPETMLFRDSLAAWQARADVELHVTLSRAGPDWTGEVGHVTGLLPGLGLDPARTVAMICGPEPMIRATAHGLDALGVPAGRVFVSLERNMKCAIALCGRCQLGSVLLCRDGPVFSWAQMRPLMRIREL